MAIHHRRIGMGLGLAVAGALLLACLADANGQTPATWTGGGGDSSYNNPANWDIAVVPIDAGGTTYAVTIPASTAVQFDVSGTTNQVTQLNLGSGSTLTVNSGRQLTVVDEAAIYGLVTTDNGTFLAEAPAARFPSNAATLAVSGGGHIAVAATSYDARGISGTATLLSAQGAGSLLDLSSLVSIDAYVSKAYVQVHTITATNGGSIDLSSLQTVRGRSSDDRLDFVIPTGGQIDLSSLQSVTGNTRFDVDVPAYSMPALETAESTTIEVSNVTALDVNALTSFHSGTLAIAVGGTVNATSLTSFTNSSLSLAPGQTLNAPAFTDIDNSRLAVSGGATHAVAAGSYSSTDLSGSYTLFWADGSGSALDLSSITSIDAYVNAAYVQTHKISATNGGRIDLSGLETVRGRAGDDYIEFVVDTGGQIDLSALLSTTAGNTRFTITGTTFSVPKLAGAVGTTFQMLTTGATLELPLLATHSGGAYSVPEDGTFNLGALTDLSSVSVTLGPNATFNAPQLTAFTNSSLSLEPGQNFATGPLTNIDNSRLAVKGGATLAVAADSYSSTGLGGTYTVFSADGGGSALDLSSISSIDAYVSASYVQAHRISATSSGQIDLSGLQTVRGRAGDDYLEFVAHSGGFLDASSLQSITAGNVRFNVYGGGQMILGSLTVTPAVTLTVTDTGSDLDVQGNLHLAGDSSFAVSGGAKIHVGGNFSFDYTDEGRFGGDDAIVQLDGGQVQWLEVGGADLGVDGAEAGNFGIAQLIVGSDDQASSVFLVDLVDNGNRSSPEALYLFGSGGLDGLRLIHGSTLLIGGINAYAYDATHDEMVHLNALLGPGQWVVPYDQGFIGSPVLGDANLDGTVGIADLGALADNYGVTEGASWDMGDFNFDGQIGIADLGALSDNYGFGQGGQAPVPEPATMVLLAAGTMVGLARRRRRQ